MGEIGEHYKYSHAATDIMLGSEPNYAAQRYIFMHCGDEFETLDPHELADTLDTLQNATRYLYLIAAAYVVSRPIKWIFKIHKKLKKRR